MKLAPKVRPLNRALAVALVGLCGLGADLEAQERSIFDTEDQLWVVGDVLVPAVADTFVLVRVQRYSQVSLGVGLVYDGPLDQSLQLTIYIYPPPTGVVNAVVFEFESAVRDVRAYARQRSEMTVVMKQEEPYTLSTGSGLTLDGMFAEAEYTQWGSTRRSLVYVFEKEGFILQYRVTHDSDAPPELQDHLDAWLRATAEQIQGYPR